MFISNKWRVLLLTCALCAAATAWALKSDRDQPIHIQSDHGDFQTNAGKNTSTGTYTGHVIITQGSIRITADKAILHTQNNQIQTADITGKPATFQQKTDTGVMANGIANEIIYDANKNQVVLRGNAHVQQGGRQMSGDVIDYNTETEHVTASGGKTSSGRINITIPPTAATSAPPAAKKQKHKKHLRPATPPPQAVTSKGGHA